MVDHNRVHHQQNSGWNHNGILSVVSSHFELTNFVQVSPQKTNYISTNTFEWTRPGRPVARQPYTGLSSSKTHLRTKVVKKTIGRDPMAFVVQEVGEATSWRWASPCTSNCQITRSSKLWGCWGFWGRWYPGLELGIWNSGCQSLVNPQYSRVKHNIV